MIPAEKNRAVSLLEVIIAFSILLVAILTMVGYTATIHRAAAEGKHQALASMESRALIEKIRDFPPLFLQAATPAGYTETRIEYLLDGEADSRKNEAGSQSAAEFHLEARAEHVLDDIYRLTVSTSWEDDGRVRQVVLETRMSRQLR